MHLGHFPSAFKGTAGDRWAEKKKNRDNAHACGAIQMLRQTDWPVSPTRLPAIL